MPRAQRSFNVQLVIPDQLLTASQLALALHVPSMTVSRLIAEAILRADFKAGKWSLFRAERLPEIRKMIHAKPTNPCPTK